MSLYLARLLGFACHVLGCVLVAASLIPLLGLWNGVILGTGLLCLTSAMLIYIDLQT
jgi:hypothetical protein